MFIFETKFYQNYTNSTKLYKKYIEKLNTINEDYFCKTIIHNESPINSIYILNKIDLCDKEGGIEKENEDFKKYLEDKLNVDLNLNEVILLNSKEYILEKDKFKDFEHYLNYIIKSEKKDEYFFTKTNSISRRGF